MSTSTSAGTGSSSTFPAPVANEAFGRLKHLLQEMFQFDRGDLDFGLYRVMNMKAGEINRFLDCDLLPQVKDVLAGIEDDERKEIEAQLDVTFKQLSELKAPIENNPRVLELRAKLESAKADAAAEADVYRHLADFFGRYYREGDFVSLRRYSGGGRPTYLIPYDGEEVKLHWANADQYYIKTTENYATYTFVCEGAKNSRRVRFEIVAADNDRDNVKKAAGKQRRFLLAKGDDAIALDDNELVIYFEHRALTDAEKKDWGAKHPPSQLRIDEAIVARILEAIRELDSGWRTALTTAAPTTTNSQRTLLAKHITRYTAKNSFDYFIHKDLGGFLSRELDLYVKTEVLNVDDLATGDPDRLRRTLARMRAVRHVGDKIIVFLAQLEDFQKRLWLKKKFVLETQWCVSLDLVPKTLYPEIASNEAQLKEWQDLISIDEVADYCEPLRTTFLNANPHLLIDTRHFNADFSERLLSALSDAGPLDEQTNGLLVHRENFQALNLLRARYSRQVQCTYIDPPYNSPSSEILYKNDFKHSSWMSLMANRLEESNFLRSDNGVLVIAIDDHERDHLAAVLSQVFPTSQIFLISIVHNKKGVQGDMLSVNNEYAYVVVPDKRRALNKLKIARPSWKYSNFRNWGGESLRSDAKTCFYPIFVKNNMILGFGEVCDDSFHPPSANVEESDGVVAVYPIDKEGVERKWRYGRESVEQVREILQPKVNSKRNEIEIEKPQIDAAIKTVWSDKRYIAGDFGTKLLTDFGLGNRFDYPKSIYTVYDSIYAISESGDDIVMDYFAGSGTTGHAVIKLNRYDGGNRKYLLVEMGDHFDTVLLPRLKKAVYAPTWVNGKPESRDKGVGQLLKYVRLESYEDTLDGLVVMPTDDDILTAHGRELAEDYRLRYALGVETAESPCLLGEDFSDPFAYRLSVVRDGVRRDTSVDLPETFNYLLGLRVESRRRLDGVLAIAGRDAKGQCSLVLWRNLEAMDNAALERWFADNRTNLPDLLDLIYVNGDHTLNAIRQPSEMWTAETIEPLFRELMFEADE